MSFSESEFKPEVKKMGIGSTVRIIDPNPLQETVPLEDLFIYVSLRAKQKSKSILTEVEGPKIKLINENRSSIDLITPQTINSNNLFSSKPMLTTDWTEIGGHNFSATKVGDNGKDFEGFGITNIDIEIKSQQTPKFVINFTDVRGATLFEQGSCSPYGLFFNLPYPMFELTVKGYYGKPVNYYLNLTKFNSKFNSETGNMDCTAEFIGYTFAFLSDVIVGYVAASQELSEEKYSPQLKLRNKYRSTRDYYLKNGLTSYNNTGDAGPWCDDPAVNPTKCTTISDLVQQLKRFETVEKPNIGGSNENIELEALTNLVNYYNNYKDAVLSLARTLEQQKGLTPQPSKSTKRGNPKKARFIFKDQALLDSLTKSPGELYVAFNHNGSFFNYIKQIKTMKVGDKSGADIIGTNSLLTTLDSTALSGNGPFPKIYDVLKDEDWNYGVLKGTDIAQPEFPQTALPPLLVNTTPYLDLGFILDNIENEIELLSGENGIVTQKRKTLIEAVNNIIEGTLGFKPTIRNVFSVLLCNTDAFMEILLEVYGKAQRYHKEQQYGDKVIVGSDNEILTSGNNKETVVYPWPTYFKKNHFSETSSVAQGTREVYPGVDFPNWWEVIFVEDFIKAYMKFVNKQEIINGDVQGKPGYDNYVPINPIESRLLNTRLQPIKYHEKTLPDIYRIIGERMFISLDHTLFQPMRLTYDMVSMPLGENWNLLNETNSIETLGKIDSWNLLNVQEGDGGKNILNVLSTVTEADFKTNIIKALKDYYGDDSLKYVTSCYEPNPAAGNEKCSIKYNPAFDVNKKIKKYGYKIGDPFYKFSPKRDAEGLIGLQVYTSNGTLVTPNPHNMDSTLLFKIIPDVEANSITQIEITEKGFQNQINQLTKDIVDSSASITYKTPGYNPDEDIFKANLVESNTPNINYAGNQSGGGNKNAITGHFLPSYDNHKLFTTLFMSDSKTGAETTWFTKGGTIKQLPASMMGSISFWANYGSNLNQYIIGLGESREILGVSLLQDTVLKNGDGRNFYVDTAHGFNGDDYPGLKSESKTGRENIEPANGVSGGFDDGISTPIVSTPFWLDNINQFRIDAGGSVLRKGDAVKPDNDDEIQNKNLAYIYLHTLKTTPFISRYVDTYGRLINEPTIQSLRSLMVTGGVAKVPKAWLLTLGAQLWRWKMFVGTKANSEGKNIWNKPLTCVGCTQGDKPSGFDPLAQPGYNFKDGTFNRTCNGVDQSKAGVMERNNLPVYLNTIYGWTFTETAKWVQYSVFNNEHQKIKGTQKVGQVQDSTNGYEFTDLTYYNAFRYANINKKRMGNLNNALREKDPTTGQDITETTETSDYSWSQNWVAPHHLMFINPEKFYGNKWIGNQGEGSGFVLIFEPNVGILDYPTIMSQTVQKLNYNDDIILSGITTDTLEPVLTARSKAKDGNLGMVFQYIPDEIKDEIVKKFEEWATTEWVTMLPVIDPVNFSDSNISMMSHYRYDDDVAKQLLGNKDESTCLALNDDHNDVINIKKSLLEDQYWLVNSTPKIWYGIGTKDQPDNANESNQFVDAFLTTKTQFDLYLKSFIDNFKKNAVSKITEIDNEKAEQNKDNNNMSIMDDTDTKLALYRTFKSIADKWISASKEKNLFFNLIENGDGTTCKGQRGGKIQDGSSEGSGPRPTLASHFQYVNRVMGDIGDEAVIDISKLSELTENPKISLYQYLVDVLVENNYLFFPLPAFVNFTGNGLADNDLVDMFRPVNSLKSISCGPLFLSMYVGGSSRQLSMIPNTTCGLDQEALNNIQDDSFTISKQQIDVARQPKDTTDPKAVNSDGFTAFKVVYGLDTQNHFKSIQLDQSEFSETAESLLVIEKLSQQGGGDQSSKGQNLNAMYLTRSYSCTVESLGNMMIQPMTYFDLIGVPMFSGAYLITEVKHSFTPNNAKTTFKGIRQPRMTTPIVTDAAVAMNISFKNNTPTGKSIATGGGNSGFIYKVQKQPGGKGSPTATTGVFDNNDITKLDNYGSTLGITDKSDNGTLYSPNQPLDKPIGNMVNSAYANLNVSTRGVPYTDNGNLGCASAVSIIFYRATGYALVGDSYITLGTDGIYSFLDAESKKPDSSWEKITNWETESKPGDIICTQANGRPPYGHVGVVVNDGKIISNSSGPYKGGGSVASGQIELNYSISGWKKDVYPRNPSQTASFRYVGPYSKVWFTATNTSQADASGPWRQDTEFLTKVKNLAIKYQFNPKDLIAVLSQESGINPKAIYPGSLKLNIETCKQYCKTNGKSSDTCCGATGINQMLPATLKKWNLTTDQYYNFSRAQQMDYVEKMFDDLSKQGYIKGPISGGILYGLNYLPARVKACAGKGSDCVLTYKGETDSNGKLLSYYESNAGLDSDKNDKITISDLDAIVKRKVQSLEPINL